VRVHISVFEGGVRVEPNAGPHRSGLSAENHQPGHSEQRRPERHQDLQVRVGHPGGHGDGRRPGLHAQQNQSRHQCTDQDRQPQDRLDPVLFVAPQDGY